jgi:hypothetical protein
MMTRRPISSAPTAFADRLAHSAGRRGADAGTAQVPRAGLRSQVQAAAAMVAITLSQSQLGVLVALSARDDALIALLGLLGSLSRGWRDSARVGARRPLGAQPAVGQCGTAESGSAVRDTAYEYSRPLLFPVVDRPDRRLSIAERALGFIQRPRFRRSLARATFTLARGKVASTFADVRERLSHESRILSVAQGAPGLACAHAVALYVHFAPTPNVSAMVLAQVEQYRALGFAVVFVSMAASLSEDASARLCRACGLVVRRRNFGLDFGAWHDLVPLVRAHAPDAEELLLVNDSVCGPFRSIRPIVQAMRMAGPGLFGLSENLAPRPHLQSYFLLARGRAAVSDSLRFLHFYHPTSDKRRTIRTGEVALTGWMRRRGHHVAAWCGYEAVEAAALERRAARARVRALYPWRVRSVLEGAHDEAAGMRSALARLPMNPTHLFWREMVEDFAFPFVKTDLLLRNPLGLADRLTWQDLLAHGGGSNADVSEASVSDHLAALAEVPATAPRPLAKAVVSGAAMIAVAVSRIRTAAWLRADPENGSDPLVSVVLPVRDRSEVLVEAVASVLAQSWRRLELIVVDDGSAFDVAAVLASRFDDARLRVVRQPASGVSAARNLGLRLACGELVAYLDSDNLWFPAFLSRMIRQFRRQPELECAYGILVSAAHRRGTGFVWDAFSRKRLESSNFIDLNVFVHRRSTYEHLGGFDEELGRLTDWDLVLRYTVDGAPARVPVLGAVYRVLDARRITDAVPLANSMGRIRAKLAAAASTHPGDGGAVA